MKTVAIFAAGFLCGAGLIFWLMWPLSAGLFLPFVCGFGGCK